MLFINWLLSLISAVTAEDLVKFAPTSSENSKETKAIRPLDEDEKKLYVVLSKLAEERKALGEEHKKLHEDSKHDRDSCKAFHKKVEELEGKIQLASKIMWQSIRMSFQENEEPNHLQISADWQLEEIISDDGHGIIISVGGEFPFTELFGGDGKGISLLDLIMR